MMPLLLRIGCVVMLAMLASCERSLRNMYDQPRDDAYGASPLFEDGASSRTPPAGTVPYARGQAAGSSSARLGASEMQRSRRDTNAQTQPYVVDQALLWRGKRRYDIYCLPCHSPIGDGDGRIVQRGFPAPPSYHIERLRKAPDRHIFNVITDGYGIMASYAGRVTPQDRWAIIAYVRALQLSQYAKLDDLPASVGERARAALDASSQPDHAAHSAQEARPDEPGAVAPPAPAQGGLP